MACSIASLKSRARPPCQLERYGGAAHIQKSVSRRLGRRRWRDLKAGGASSGPQRRRGRSHRCCRRQEGGRCWIVVHGCMGVVCWASGGCLECCWRRIGRRREGFLQPGAAMKSWIRDLRCEHVQAVHKLLKCCLPVSPPAGILAGVDVTPLRPNRGFGMTPQS